MAFTVHLIISSERPRTDRGATRSWQTHPSPRQSPEQSRRKQATLADGRRRRRRRRAGGGGGGGRWWLGGHVNSWWPMQPAACPKRPLTRRSRERPHCIITECWPRHAVGWPAACGAPRQCTKTLTEATNADSGHPQCLGKKICTGSQNSQSHAKNRTGTSKLNTGSTPYR